MVIQLQEHSLLSHLSLNLKERRKLNVGLTLQNFVIHKWGESLLNDAPDIYLRGMEESNPPWCRSLSLWLITEVKQSILINSRVGRGWLLSIFIGSYQSRPIRLYTHSPRSLNYEVVSIC